MTFDWTKIDTSTIVGGVAPDGSSYLKTFLIDYKTEFHVEKVNPNCGKCLKEYHMDFIKKYGNMENQSKYRLHKKREGLQLGFGSSIFVNNKNITDDYAEKLIKKYTKLKPDFTLDYLFSHYPKAVEKIEVIEEITEATPVKKTRKKRK
jgi:hypothetical protein